MNFYAVTLKNQHRSNFNDEIANLRNAIDFIEFTNPVIIHPYLFELMPTQGHLMHVHLLIEAIKLDYREIHLVMKNKDINCDIQKLETKEDVNRWRNYCVKYRGDLAYDYAESTGKEYNQINCFKNIIRTAQQMVCSKCHLEDCVNINDPQNCIYKWWNR